MKPELICVTGTEEGLDAIEQSDLDVNVYSDPSKALEAYKQGEGVAIITDSSHEKIKKKIEGENLKAPIFSALNSDFYSDLTNLLNSSYDEDLMSEGDFGVYGLAPTINRGIENSPVGVTAAIRDEDGNHPMFYVNEGFERVTGYNRADALGRDCNFLQGEGTDQNDVALIRQALEDKEPVRTTILNYDADGQEFWNELEIWPVEVGNQDVFLGYQRDVSERESYRQDLEMIIQILRHDLANDQVVMGGHLEILKDKLEEEMGDIPRELKVIEERLGSVASKVDKLEQMKESESLDNKETIDLYEKVKKTAFNYREQAESKGFKIDVRDPGRDVIVENRSHLDDYFGNIYENSIEHYPDDENEGIIEVDWNFKPDSVEVKISDDGEGMDTKRENWGVGLFTINRIANMEDIGMSLESDDGLTVTSEFEIIEE